jgi:hypothetical protein
MPQYSCKPEMASLMSEWRGPSNADYQLFSYTDLPTRP